MATRRLNPRLAKAFEDAAIEPLDYDTPGRIVEVPVPQEHFEQPKPAAPAPQKTRLQMMEEYLARTRLPEAEPDFGAEPDIDAARERDARYDFGQGMLAAGQAFTGNRAAVGQLKQTSANEQAALSAEAARKKAIADWAESKQKRRLDEGELLSRAAAEPGKKDPELERERLAIERQRVEQQGELGGRKAELEEKKLEEKMKPKPAKPGDPSALRKEFNALPEVKQFQEVDAAYRKIQSAAKNVSAAGDLSLIFSYMKMLDPGSTVREGEFANAQNAGGVDDKLIAAYNNVRAGQRLTDSQRADFVNQAGQLYEAQRQQFSAAAKRYQGFATKKGLTPEDVAVDVQPSAGSTSGQAGKLPMISTATGKIVYLSPAAAAAMEKAGKVRKP